MLLNIIDKKQKNIKLCLLFILYISLLLRVLLLSRVCLHQNVAPSFLTTNSTSLCGGCHRFAQLFSSSLNPLTYFFWAPYPPFMSPLLSLSSSVRISILLEITQLGCFRYFYCFCNVNFGVSCVAYNIVLCICHLVLEICSIRLGGYSWSLNCLMFYPSLSSAKLFVRQEKWRTTPSLIILLHKSRL